MHRLKVIRKEFNLKQKELANRIGRKQSTISDIEKEKYPMEKVMALAIEAILGINAEWLLTGKGEKYKKSNVSSPVLEDVLKNEIIKIINVFWVNANSEEKIWLKIQLQKWIHG